MVIQRWQSVLLLVASAAMFCFTFLSLGQVQTGIASYNFTTLGFVTEGVSTDGGVSGEYMHTWFLFALSLFGAVLSLVSIFCFRNLKRQTNLCMVSLLAVIAAASYCAVLGYTAFSDGVVSWSSVAFAPLIALIGIIMAVRYIRRDAARLRAVDRIR